jgi:hypothetical protein
VFSSRRSWWNVLGAGLLAAGTIAAATGTSLVSAGASPGPLVGPNQLFAGFVNGNHFSPTVRMACFGPIRPGETGHPLAGQTFSVQLEVDVPGGFTAATASLRRSRPRSRCPVQGAAMLSSRPNRQQATRGRTSFRSRSSASPDPARPSRPGQSAPADDRVDSGFSVRIGTWRGLPLALCPISCSRRPLPR